MTKTEEFKQVMAAVGHFSRAYSNEVLSASLPPLVMARIAGIIKDADKDVRQQMPLISAFAWRRADGECVLPPQVEEASYHLSRYHQAYFSRQAGKEVTPLSMMTARHPKIAKRHKALTDALSNEEIAEATLNALGYVMARASTLDFYSYVKPILPLVTSLLLGQTPAGIINKDGEPTCLDPIHDDGDFLYMASALVAVTTVVLYSPGRVGVEQRAEIGKLLYPYHSLDAYYPPFPERTDIVPFS